MEFKVHSNGDLVSISNIDAVKPLLEKCLQRLGRLKESNPDFISGWIRYGFQKVKIRISWKTEGDTVHIVIQSSSDDVWNGGGKNAKRRLSELIVNHSNNGFYVDRLGMRPSVLFGISCLFILIVGLLLSVFSKFVF
jgi:hypothetical protein